MITPGFLINSLRGCGFETKATMGDDLCWDHVMEYKYKLDYSSHIKYIAYINKERIIILKWENIIVNPVYRLTSEQTCILNHFDDISAFRNYYYNQVILLNTKEKQYTVLNFTENENESKTYYDKLFESRL